MPHQCVHCGALYGDGAREVLEGCVCGGRLFFFVKKAKLEESRRITEALTSQQKEQIEKDVMHIIGFDDGVKQPDQPVILDLESIRITKPGTYELDLVNLFKRQPLIYRVEEGKYIIDLPESFKRARDRIRQSKARKGKRR